VGASAFHRSIWPEIVRRYEAGEQMKLIAEELGVDRKRLTFQRQAKPSVGKHRGGLGRVSLHGTNAATAAEILLASTPVSLQRKRRILEGIVERERNRHR
jgi:hypothetical protein